MVKLPGLLLPIGSISISLTRTVPAAVPSLFHSSDPWVASVALKKRRPFASVNSLRLELPPGKISFTRTVPEGKPLVLNRRDRVGAPNR